MLFNFKNLCANDIDDVIDGKEKRKSMSILCKIDSIYTRPTSYGKDEIPGWAIVVDTESGPNPKVHFTNLEAVEKLYNSLVQALVFHNAEITEIDVLEHGAL